MNRERLDVAVIGVGVAGSRHADAQAELGSIVSLYDTDTTRALNKKAELKTRYPNASINVAKSLQNAVAQKDLVYVATPDHLHVDPAIKAIQHGTSHIFIEKPVTARLKDAKTIREEAAKNKASVIIGTNYRLESVFEYVKLLVDQRNEQYGIGDIVSIYTSYIHNMEQYRKKTPWRKNQNFLYGGGVHAVDLAMHIMNEPVIEVNAVASGHWSKDYNRPEDYRINLISNSGITAHVWLNALAITEENKHGTDLQVNARNATLITHNKSNEVRKILGEETIIDYSGQCKTVNRAAVLLNNHVRSGGKESHYPLPDINEAVRVMKVMDAVERASFAKKTIIVEE